MVSRRSISFISFSYPNIKSGHVIGFNSLLFILRIGDQVPPLEYKILILRPHLPAGQRTARPGRAATGAPAASMRLPEGEKGKGE